jgi:hypothetical protein
MPTDNPGSVATTQGSPTFQFDALNGQVNRTRQGIFVGE